MRPLRSKSLALWMAPLLWAGLLLQSGAWACGCLEHNPWMLTIAHCVVDLDHYDHPAESVVGHAKRELAHYHIPTREVYLSDARVVEPADVEVQFLPWNLSETSTLTLPDTSSIRPHAPPQSSLTSGPFRALLQVYLL